MSETYEPKNSTIIIFSIWGAKKQIKVKNRNGISIRFCSVVRSLMLFSSFIHYAVVAFADSDLIIKKLVIFLGCWVDDYADAAIYFYTILLLMFQPGGCLYSMMIMLCWLFCWCALVCVMCIKWHGWMNGYG